MISVPDPDVVFTDLGLAALGAFLGWRLWRRGRPGVVMMAGLASAAFWGALFHACFPTGTATSAGFATWLLVAFSIAVVAESLLDMSLSVFMARLNTTSRRTIVALYCAVFVAVVLFIDASFSAIVLLYGPTLGLGLAAAGFEAIRTRSRGWALVALGLTVSAAAALLQQTRVALHPVYFDHNAVYHVVQGAAVVLLYWGFHERSPRTDPAARAA